MSEHYEERHRQEQQEQQEQEMQVRPIPPHHHKPHPQHQQHLRRPLEIDKHQSPHTLYRRFARPDCLKDPLYVVTSVFNPIRYRSRWKLYEDFCKMCAETGAILYTVEVAFGDRAFCCTDENNPFHLQLRTWHEIWFKEAALNLAVQCLPHDWKYVAWVDADTHFARYDWADETRHLLQHYPIIQMWSQMHDLDSNFQLVGSTRSFGDVWMSGEKPPPGWNREDCKYYYPHRGYPGAPGLAWAMRREAWEQLGGLIDYCILGAGDWYMAHALTGQIERVLAPGQHPRLKEKLRQYQHHAERSLWQERPICGNLGVMKGLALHYWHGPKLNRRYRSREQILYG